MRVGHIGSTFHSGSLQRLYWSLLSDVCSPECDEWLCRHFPLVSHCPQTSLRRARHPDVGPNELFVLRLQSGNGLFPTDDKGNLLAGKSTFLDAWEVRCSFSKYAQNFHQAPWTLHPGVKMPKCPVSNFTTMIYKLPLSLLLIYLIWGKVCLWRSENTCGRRFSTSPMWVSGN